MLLLLSNLKDGSRESDGDAFIESKEEKENDIKFVSFSQTSE